MLKNIFKHKKRKQKSYHETQVVRWMMPFTEEEQKKLSIIMKTVDSMPRWYHDAVIHEMNAFFEN